MLFSSWQFIFVFLPATLLIFFLIPARLRVVRKIWLTAASFAFYGYWKVEYLPLLIFSILGNYGIAEGIIRSHNRKTSHGLLFIGVATNLLLLGYFKYTKFILEILGRLPTEESQKFDIILPLAISFFTFTQIAYLVDVHRDQSKHYSFLDYALFVVFFPHLIAGPIVRHWEIIPQYAEKELRPNRGDLGTGLSLFMLGLFKKVLIADTISEYADKMYSAAAAGGSITCIDGWLGTLSFALQIYFDFSGYSDMAIGLARMFGIKFPRNFNSPYQAASLAEFWQRWHMTLSRFLREYVYFPLGGNRVGKFRHVFNVLTTMLLSGLWHGAGWTFVIWGAIHGSILVIIHAWQRLQARLGWELKHWTIRSVCIVATFMIVLFTWVFFRAPNIDTAKRVLASMTGANGFTVPDKVGDAKFGIRETLKAVGFTVVPAPLALSSYRDQVRLLLLLVFIVWLAPNTHQLLASYTPTLEDTSLGRLRITLNLGTGLVFGAFFFYVVRTYFTAAPSPFLYFNF
ncbi:MAG: rane bound O-acyl transferase family protein [Verrucomicrobiales bacterium]|nr:rane bound O-acyl transferase family protein [Verrucomicrobiales bacterium]